MAEFDETIARLDAVEDFQGLHDYLQRNADKIEQLAGVVYQLLLRYRLRGAYLIAQMLKHRLNNPVLSLALCLGGMVTGNGEDEAEGHRHLRKQIDSLSEADRLRLYLSLEPMIKILTSNAYSSSGGHLATLKVLEVLKDLAPVFRHMFDFDCPIPKLDSVSLKAAGRRRARLVDMTPVPPGEPRKARRAVVGMRELFFPQNPNSRQFEIGPIMTAALNAYGWSTTMVPLKCGNALDDDFRRITETCVAEMADVLFLDEQLIEAPVARAARKAMIPLLRRVLPNLKIVAVHLDPWSLEPPLLASAAVDVDAVWTFAPELPAWSQPEFKGRLFVAPLPHAGDYGGPILPLRPSMTFIGSIFAYNWHRWFWMSAASATKLPLEIQQSQQVADGLPVVESYLHYIRRLADSRCAVNFSLRPNLTPAITGRTFEILAGAALLIQEATTDLDCFLIAGEHYLEFTSIADLRAIAAFIAERPGDAESIRKSGNAFFRETYSDDRVIGTLDRRLHYPGK